MFNDVGGGSMKDLEGLEDGRYFLRLKLLEDQGPQEQYAKTRDDGSMYVPRSVRWTFQLGLNIETPLFGASGTPIEIYAWTSEAVGPKSTARPWMEALLQRSLQTGDKGEQLAKELPGRVAWGMISVQRTTDPLTQTVKIRPKILSMSRYVDGTPSAAAPVAPVSAPVPVAAGAPTAAALPWA